jgi:hypothetical protein
VVDHARSHPFPVAGPEHVAQVSRAGILCIEARDKTLAWLHLTLFRLQQHSVEEDDARQAAAGARWRAASSELAPERFESELRHAVGGGEGRCLSDLKEVPHARECLVLVKRRNRYTRALLEYSSRALDLDLYL